MQSPFGGWRHHLSPASGGTTTRAYCRAADEARPRGVLFFPLNRGKSGEARIGGGERSEPISRMPIMSYDAESKSRNADFMLIARKGDNHNPRPEGPSNLRTLRPIGPVHLKNTFYATLLHNLPPLGGHNLRGAAPSTLTPKVCPKPLPSPSPAGLVQIRRIFQDFPISIPLHQQLLQLFPLGSFNVLVGQHVGQGGAQGYA